MDFDTRARDALEALKLRGYAVERIKDDFIFGPHIWREITVTGAITLSAADAKVLAPLIEKGVRKLARMSGKPITEKMDVETDLEKKFSKEPYVQFTMQDTNDRYTFTTMGWPPIQNRKTYTVQGYRMIPLSTALDIEEMVFQARNIQCEQYMLDVLEGVAKMPPIFSVVRISERKEIYENPSSVHILENRMKRSSRGLLHDWEDFYANPQLLLERPQTMNYEKAFKLIEEDDY